MSYYSWITDNHNIYVEMKYDREWTGRNYRYKYYIKAYSFSFNSKFNNNDHYKLPFHSKQEMVVFYNKLSYKFNKIRNDRYDHDARKYFYEPVSIEKLVEITEETIKEMQYNKRKTTKLFQALFENL